VSQEANDRYFAEMMRKRHRQIFWQDSCKLANSYYFDDKRRRALAAGQHGRGVLAQPPLPARRLPLHRVARACRNSMPRDEQIDTAPFRGTTGQPLYFAGLVERAPRQLEVDRAKRGDRR